MKTYKKQTLLLCFLIGVITITVMASNAIYNACAFANDNILFIKEQTQLALNAKSFDLAKYHAYKALKGMEKTKTNVVDCGCVPALKTVSQAETKLREATQTESHQESKVHLSGALSNIIMTVNALQDFEKEYSSSYGDDILVMNTKEVLNEQGGILLTPVKKLQQSMDKGLAEFETSLSKVVAHVECEDAFNFINKILSKSERHLEEDTLTQAQRQYHTRVKAIAYDALLKLEGCPVK